MRVPSCLCRNHWCNSRHEVTDGSVRNLTSHSQQFAALEWCTVLRRWVYSRFRQDQSVLWRRKISVPFAARAAIEKAEDHLRRCFETKNGNLAQAACWNKLVPEFHPQNEQYIRKSWRALIVRASASVPLELLCFELIVISALSARTDVSNRFRRTHIRMLTSDDSYPWTRAAICVGVAYFS